MASIFGHVVSVIGLKQLFPDRRFRKKALILGIISSVIPDLDVVGYYLGIIAYGPYNFLAHRGFTHSIVFSLLWSFIIIMVFHRKETSKFLLGSYYFACTVSHCLLDGLTNGGDGIMYFAPFDLDRYFLPWRIIEVSPIGIGSFLSTWGLEVLWSELIYIGFPALLLYLFGRLLNKRIYS